MENVTSQNSPPRVTLERMFNTMRNGLFSSMIHAPQYYPEMSMLRFLGKKVYMINNPVPAQYVLQKNYTNYLKGAPYRFLAILLGKGLVTNEGESWHKQRTLIQPAFHRESLRHISKVVTQSTNHLLEKWKGQEGSTINFSRDMAELTIDIVAKSLFTADVTPEMVQTVWRNINYLNETASQLIQNPLSLPWSFPTPGYIRGRKYVKELDDIIFGIINKRRKEKSNNVDLLQLLLDARYEDTGTGMSDTQLRDEVMTIFVAGHETTVNALGWTWYLLKQHKEVENKLRDESTKYASGRDPLFEDLPHLEYGKNAMNESMRFYPPISGVARQSIAADVVGGYFIPPNSEIGINIAGIHRHPAYWRNAFEFMPERFEHFDMKGDNRFVFMPFGGGPRICIGNNFAMMEMQLINAMISSRVEMELVSTQIKPVALVTLKPGNGVIMRLGKVKA
jgi:cytochrome P450